jgi:serine/threonine-protein kinase
MTRSRGAGIIDRMPGGRDSGLDDTVAAAAETVAGEAAGTPQAGAGAARDAALSDTLAATAPAAAGGRDGLGIGPGDRLDRFVVLDLLGEGGMGAVYSAYDPELDRRVAIKLLRPQCGGQTTTGGAAQRLLREAQAMARLAHPNVVTVYDVGTVADGVFVAMEFIDGSTLRAWLEAAPRTTAEIVAVLVQAGHGLAAAHAAGLVHRDFKPENVLLRRDGRVCVSDFGLAGVSAEAELERTLPAGGPDRPATISGSAPLGVTLTQAGQLLGTPAYMAPEQHERGRVDARADQFSFCVTLYEALYGQRPFAFSSYGELRDCVSTGKITPPPAGVPVPSHVREAVLRGLAPDPARRFPSIAALLTALTTDPRAARRRTLRRVALAAAGLGLAVAVGTGLKLGRPGRCGDATPELAGAWDATTRAAVRGAFQATGRTYAADTFERVASSLDVYASAWAAMRTEACVAHERHRQPARVYDLRMRCLDRRRARLAALTALFAQGPDPQVLDKAVQATSGLVPIGACADVDALAAAVPPPEDPRVRRRVEELRRRLDAVEALSWAGKPTEALAAATALVAEARGVTYRPLLGEALLRLGELQARAGDARAGETTLGEALETAAAGHDDALLARVWTELVNVVGYYQARYPEALVLGRAAETAVARAGGDEALRSRLLVALGVVAQERGQPEEARKRLEAALSSREKTLGTDHPEVAEIRHYLGAAYMDLGRLADARRTLERALATWQRTLGPGHPAIARTLSNLAEVERAEGRLARARSDFERAAALLEKALGPDHPTVGGALNNVGAVLQDEGQHAEAQRRFERALAIWQKALGPEHPHVALALGNSAESLALQGRFEEARGRWERAVHLREKAFGRDHARLAFPLTGLGDALVGLKRAGDAVPVLERALRLAEAGKAPAAELSQTRLTLARALVAARRDPARARALATRARDGAPARSKERAAATAWLESHAPR